ncbi:YebC/PmpR family DNA-binding transcriptional regulator [Candidatus Dependentiae bacterium]|nr:YebC/PmpR family DNA-binding transcriptional regulator [Candidatus Dependentiae bacterium]
MAGHSKWANIKHKKAKEDAKRGKQFTTLIKEITVCAKVGGDVHGNPRLRHLVEKAKKLNMPGENITRAIKKGTGELPGVSYESVTYEGYGPGGIAIIVDVLTDNKNRAVADMRVIFSRNGGHLAETGAVHWMFEKRGVIRAKSDTMTEDELLEKLLDYDIEEITKDETLFIITTTLTHLNEITEAIKAIGLSVEESEIEWVAKNLVQVSQEHEEKAMNLLEKLEENDDVQNVYTNLK